MSQFTAAVWLVVKIGLVLAVIPTVLYFILQVVPALLTNGPGAWTQ